MDHPLYGAALFLNPGKFFLAVDSGDDALVGELRSCFNDVLAKMVLDVETRDKIDAQFVLYEGRRGTFANVMAIQNMDKRAPRKLISARSKLISASYFLYKLLVHVGFYLFS